MNIQGLEDLTFWLKENAAGSNPVLNVFMSNEHATITCSVEINGERKTISKGIASPNFNKGNRAVKLECEFIAYTISEELKKHSTDA